MRAQRTPAAAAPLTWSERIQALVAAGWTQRRIARKVGSSPGSISDLACGRSVAPLGDIAVALHQLHARVCGRRVLPSTNRKGKDAAPRTR